MEQYGLFDTAAAGPPGFEYRPEFLSRQEESELIASCATVPFAPFEFHGFRGKRRVMSYGWRYAFDRRGGLSAADPIPEFLLPVRDRAARLVGADPSAFEHVLVTEYGPGAGIGWHKDRSVFGETIAVSLLASCRLRFRRRGGAGWERKSVEVGPRSLYRLAGPSRTEWEHGIPPTERLRYSITLRTLARRSLMEEG
jgi:alkylated DNA repair dioxygenase AlkB